MPFNYTLPINVTVSDIEPSVGWTGGGSLITINANNFLDTDQLSCMFDTTIVSGIYINATLIQCITPPHTNATVNVSVSNDLYEWVLLPEQLHLYSHDQ